MKKYIVAAALAMVLSAAAFSSAQAFGICGSQVWTPAGCMAAGTQISANPGVLRVRAKALIGYFTTRQIPDASILERAGLNQNDFLALARDAEQFFSARQRVLAGYKSGAPMPNFDAIYGQLAFATPDAAKKWYGEYINYILGQESFSPGNEQGDLIFFSAKDRSDFYAGINDTQNRAAVGECTIPHCDGCKTAPALLDCLSNSHRGR